MKIRTITTGFRYKPNMNEEEFNTLVTLTKQARELFEKNKYIVQTIRMSTQPWEDYASTKKELLQHILQLEQWIKNQSIEYFNMGPTNEPHHISWLPDILQQCKQGFVTVNICNEKKIYYDSIKETAKAIKKIAVLEPQGFANLRFAALCNIKPHTPFYPASYHQGSNPSFGIGFENSDLAYQAFNNAESIEDAKDKLESIMINTIKPIETLAESFSKTNDILFNGIDTSICTSIEKQESIAYAFEHLYNKYQFGMLGTLTVAKIITDVLQSLPVKKTGYCGLMLPVLEDHGLAMRNKENCFSITNLLLYSAVCGTGLDTIPLPGDVSVDELYRLLLDVATLSIKLQKPLSARLMPIPGKKAEDLTKYTFDYFKNSTVMHPF